MVHTEGMTVRLLALAGLCIAPAALNAQPAPVDTLHWLAGCWTFATPTTTIEEQWMQPRGGSMVGMSRTVTNGRHREHEFLRIFASGDTLVYAAAPDGDSPSYSLTSGVPARGTQASGNACGSPALVTVFRDRLSGALRLRPSKQQRTYRV